MFAVAFRATVGRGYQFSQREFDAIRDSKTGVCDDPLNAVGDKGCSYGPFQIMQGYYDDVVELNPTLHNSVDSIDISGPGSIEESTSYTKFFRQVHH